MQYLKADTSVKVVIGPFVDVGDGFTPETGITLGAADEAEVLKHDNATTVDISSNTWAALTGVDGYYHLTLSTTDTNTEGMLTVVVQDDSVCLPVRADFMVMNATAYDALYSNAGANLPVNVLAVSGDTTAADNLEADYDGTGYNKSASTVGTVSSVTGAVGSITGVTFPTNFADLSITATTGRVDVAAIAGTAQTANDNGADINAILVDTGTTLETHLTDIKGATFSGSTDSLEAIRDRGDAAWTTGAGSTPPQLLQSTTIATLASQTSFTLTAGSADDDAYNGAIAVITDSATSTQKAVGTVSDYTGSTKTVTLSADPGIFTMAVGDTIEIIAALGSTATAAQIADAVLDEALSGHTTAGSLGKAIADTETDAAAILVDTAEIGAAGAGLTEAGGTGDHLTAVPWNAAWDAEVQSEVADGLVDIGLDHLINSALPTSWAVDVASGSVFDQIADDGTAAYDRTTDSLQAVRDHVGDGTNLTEAGGTGDHLTAAGLSAAQVNAEVVDALATDTYAEPGQGAPAATTTLAAKINYLYKAWRNRSTQTGSQYSLYNDDNTTVDHKATVSDDGTTADKAKVASGP